MTGDKIWQQGLVWDDHGQRLPHGPLDHTSYVCKYKCRNLRPATNIPMMLIGLYFSREKINQQAFRDFCMSRGILFH